MDANPELIAIFRDEVAETLDALAVGLESLRDPGDDCASALDAAFRHAHNLKGAARMVGHDTVVAITHAMEDALSVHREAGSAPPAEIVGCMLEALSIIERAVEGSNEEAAAEPIVAKLRGNADEDTPPAPAKPARKARGTSTRGAKSPAKPSRGRAAKGANGSRPAADAKPARDADADPKQAEDDPGTCAPDAPPAAGGGAAADAPSPSAAGSVRVDIARLDRLMGYTGELLVAHSGQGARSESLEQITEDFRKLVRGLVREQRTDFEQLSRRLDELVTATRQGVRVSGYLNDEIGNAMKRLRMLPLSGLAAQWRRIVREAAQHTHRAVALQLDVGDIEMDKHVLDALRDPIMHLLRNAVGHGIEDAAQRAAAGKPETGQVAVRARMHGARVEITVSDDGRGFDVSAIAEKAVEKGLVTAHELRKMGENEILGLMFRTGFSTAVEVSQLSGRGVGLDVVRNQVQALSGEARVAHDGETGGAMFSLVVPLSLVSDRGLLVRVGDSIGVLGVNDIERTLLAERSDLKEMGDAQVLEVAGEEPLVVRSLAALIGERNGADDCCTVVIVRHGRARVGLVVSSIIGEERFVTKRLPWNLASVPGVQGGVILADGRVALVLDAGWLVDTRTQAHLVTSPEPDNTPQISRVLVVDDSVTSRTLERNILQGAGYDVLVANDGEEAWKTLQDESVDLVVSDVEMPHCTGLELVTRIRGSDKHRDVPVILVTSLGSDQDLEAGARVGADEYIVKGRFDQRQLLEAVARLI